MADTQEWTPLSVALGAGGLDLRQNQVAQAPDVLTEAVNLRYRNDKGLYKRNGHTGGPVLSGAEYVNLNLAETRTWLYGWGDYESTFPGNQFYLTQQRQLKGATSLAGNPVVWTGDRLFSYSGNERWSGSSPYWLRLNSLAGIPRGIPCYLPRVDVSRLDQGVYNPEAFDRSVGEKYSVVVTKGNGFLNATISDVSTGAVVTRNLDLLQSVSTSPKYVTAVYLNGRHVVVYSDSVSGGIYLTSMTEDHPSVWTAPTLRANGQKFDVEVVSDSTVLVAWRDPADSNIKATYFHGETPVGAPFAPATALVTSGAADAGCAVTVSPQTGEIALIWQEAAVTKARCFASNGVALAAAFNLTAGDAGTYLTVAPRYTFDGSGRSQFVAYYHVASGVTKVKSFTKSGVTSATHDKYWCWPASRAFRVGDEVFCWFLALPHTNNTLQACYFLGAGVTQMRIVGALARGSARLGDDHLPGVRGSGSAFLFVLPENARRDGLASDIRPLIGDAEFLPRLSTGEFGRAVYFASALPQTFDGREVNEAGFLLYPEVTTVASANLVGGGLVPGDVRQYRVYAVHRNAGGEVVRSPALTYIAPAVGAGHNANNVTFTTVPATSRVDAWFEVYATTNGGAVFYLTSPALAATAPQNTFSASTVTFADLTADIDLVKRPIDPFQPVLGQAGNLETSSLPGCSVMYSGRDRLWLAGGDVESGSVAFSKLRVELEGAGWSDQVGSAVIDHLGQAVTSIGEVGDSLVVFLRDRIWAVAGGPDNNGLGGFAIPSLVQAGVGSINHAGTVQTPKGLAFWSDSGPRLLTNGYAVVDLSHRTYPLTTELSGYVTAAVSVPGQEEVRWYTTTGTAILWDHRANDRNATGRWAVWTGLPAAGAVYFPATGYPVLALTDGRVLVEDTATFTDAGAHYEMSWSTPEMRPSELVQGHNRFRRFALRGEYRGPHTLGIWAYYDGSPMWTRYREWVTADNLYAEGWGSGSGTWNTDPTGWIEPPAAGYGSFRLLDGSYRLRDRLKRQPGATLKLRFSDLGAPNDTVLAEELAVELGAKPGLTRIPSGLSTPSAGLSTPSGGRSGGGGGPS